MSWENFFPWNPVKVVYERKSESKVIDQNYHILNCNFKKTSESPIIQNSVVEVLLLIDHCNFAECISQNGEGIVFLQISKSGCVAVSNTYATECDAKAWHFLRITTEEKSSIVTRSNQLSVSSCGQKISTGQHIVSHICGHSDYIGSNISHCESIYRTFSLDHVSNSICSWINLATNSASDCIILINFRGILKKCNVIKNTQKNRKNIYHGLFCTRDPYSHLAVDNCYVSDNDCESLASTDSGEIYFFQCHIDKVVSIRNAVVASLVTLNSFVYKPCIYTHIGNIEQIKFLCLHIWFIGNLEINLFYQY